MDSAIIGTMSGIAIGLLLFILTIMLISLLFGYIVDGIFYMKLAKHNNIGTPWLAWIPIANIYLFYLIGKELASDTIKSYRNKFLVSLICGYGLTIMGTLLPSSDSAMLLIFGGLFQLVGFGFSVYLAVLMYYPIFKTYFKDGEVVTLFSIMFSLVRKIMFIVILARGIENEYIQGEEINKPKKKKVTKNTITEDVVNEPITKDEVITDNITNESSTFNEGISLNEETTNNLGSEENPIDVEYEEI